MFQNNIASSVDVYDCIVHHLRLCDMIHLIEVSQSIRNVVLRQNNWYTIYDSAKVLNAFVNKILQDTVSYPFEQIMHMYIIDKNEIHMHHNTNFREFKNCLFECHYLFQYNYIKLRTLSTKNWYNLEMLRMKHLCIDSSGLFDLDKQKIFEKLPITLESLLINNYASRALINSLTLYKNLNYLMICGFTPNQTIMLNIHTIHIVIDDIIYENYENKVTMPYIKHIIISSKVNSVCAIKTLEIVAPNALSCCITGITSKLFIFDLPKCSTPIVNKWHDLRKFS